MAANKAVKGGSSSANRQSISNGTGSKRKTFGLLDKDVEENSCNHEKD